MYLHCALLTILTFVFFVSCNISAMKVVCLCMGSNHMASLLVLQVTGYVRVLKYYSWTLSYQLKLLGPMATNTNNFIYLLLTIKNLL
jgi:hypothetical protein